MSSPTDHMWVQLSLALNVSVPFSISVSPIDDSLVLPCCATEKLANKNPMSLVDFIQENTE